jgi:phage protein D
VAEIVPQLNYVINYEGKNITDDVSRYLFSLKYKDSTKDKADELEIALDDTEGKWHSSWYPKKKDKIIAKISDGISWIECGTFTIDEIEFEGPPDIIIIRALATSISEKLRTKKSISHESKTLKQIAQSICDAHGFTLDVGTHVVTKAKEVQTDIDKIELIKSDLFEAREQEKDAVISILQRVGPKVGTVTRDLRKKDLSAEADIMEDGFRWVAHTNYTAAALDYYSNRLTLVQNMLSPYLQKTEKLVVANDLSSIQIERSTQNQETDLFYLARIAKEYGFYFNIKGSTMIFYQVYNLEGRNPSFTLTKSQCSKFSIKDTSVGTVKSTTVTSHNPQTNEVITATAESEPAFPIRYMPDKYYQKTGFGVLKTSSSKTASTAPFDTGSGSSQQNNQDPNEEVAEDTQEIKTKAETQQQAEAQAKSGQHKKNKHAVSGSITTAFNTNLVSGNNFTLADAGELSGIYHIEEADVTLERSGGASVTCEIYRVGKVDKSQRKLKK